MCNFNIFIIYGSTPPLQLQHSPPLSNPQEDDESYDTYLYRELGQKHKYTLNKLYLDSFSVRLNYASFS